MVSFGKSIPTLSFYVLRLCACKINFSTGLTCSIFGVKSKQYHPGMEQVPTRIVGIVREKGKILLQSCKRCSPPLLGEEHGHGAT